MLATKLYVRCQIMTDMVYMVFRLQTQTRWKANPWQVPVLILSHMSNNPSKYKCMRVLLKSYICLMFSGDLSFIPAFNFLFIFIVWEVHCSSVIEMHCYPHDIFWPFQSRNEALCLHHSCPFFNMVGGQQCSRLLNDEHCARPEDIRWF